MVEAPGTAPGSTTIIPITVYRHSQQADSRYVGGSVSGFKLGFQPPVAPLQVRHILCHLRPNRCRHVFHVMHQAAQLPIFVDQWNVP
jgi:hypothetical protein